MIRSAALALLLAFVAPLAFADAESTAVTIKSADGKSSYAVTATAAKVQVAIGGAAPYTGETRGDKRDWRDPAGKPFVEVKATEKGFKLRSPDGKTLYWKVKFDADKIKISDNEENNNAYELKIKDDKIKVSDGADAPLGEVKHHADTKKVKVKDASGAERFSADAAQPSASYGVLLLGAIPEPQRAVLLAEILARYR
jgi:hypothetical protein